MDRAYLRDGGSGAIKQFKHVVVPSAFAHAMRMHLADEQYPPWLYYMQLGEEAGTAFAVDDHEEGGQAPYADELFMEELKGLGLFDGCSSGRMCQIMLLSGSCRLRSRRAGTWASKR